MVRARERKKERWARCHDVLEKLLTPSVLFLGPPSVLCLFVCLFVCLSFCLCLSHTLFLSPRLCVSPSLSLSLFLSFSLSLSVWHIVLSMSIICIICHNQVCKHLEHSCARITDTTH